MKLFFLNHFLVDCYSGVDMQNAQYKELKKVLIVFRESYVFVVKMWNHTEDGTVDPNKRTFKI